MVWSGRSTLNGTMLSRGEGAIVEIGFTRRAWSTPEVLGHQGAHIRVYMGNVELVLVGCVVRRVMGRLAVWRAETMVGPRAPLGWETLLVVVRGSSKAVIQDDSLRPPGRAWSPSSCHCFPRAVSL